ncbi:N(2)-fixation sustaining protein CowN [Parazoarcus communis]|uniref:N(2)-fixation sustaining protein CowN n=1 Tax=Parazoarcus communis TaxID=41977 RepID=A0A2U8GS52_9RHOO|nr:N(2)-fixation sustaining protein CowN [Parazoarcus communis]AWI76310.1 N(2)-fixation sustaining protein CowN [Parazoarcus communis]|tara:strand:- start:7602 stop:7907 length:306 start_codon:yes stop_codon:yes gene_type:complete
MSTPPSPCCAAQPDRYVSFKGIDCDGNARRLMDILLRLRSEDPDEQTLLKLFKERRAATTGVRCDDLLLLASFVNPVRELFERHHDQEALDLLEQLEEQCF